MTWGTFNSFLELTFAINVMFATWPGLGKVLEDKLVERAKLEQSKKESLKNEVMKVSERIFSFEKRCDKYMPRWRFMAGAMAAVILVLLFLFPDSMPIDHGLRALILAAILPPIGAFIHLGADALYCAQRNRKDMKSSQPLDSAGVKAIADRISGEGSPHKLSDGN